MKKFVLLWSVILAIALVGSAFASDSSELRSPKPAKLATLLGDKTVLVEEKAVPEEPGAITATNEYQEKVRPEKVLPYIVTGVPAVGDDCTDPIIVNLPAELPYLDANQTTCGRANTYWETCLGYYDGGEDITYQLNVTAEVTVDIFMDPKGTTWTGMLIADECPGVFCIAYSTGSSGGRALTGITLPVGTYYIMVDTWPSPDCIPDFDLTIEEAQPPPPPPPNDDCENAEFVAGPFPVSGPGTTVGATVDCPGVLDWNGVWYVFDLPYASNNVFIELCPDNIDLYTVGIVLMDDCACDDYVIRDVGLFGTCASGYTGYTMTWNNVPGPATWYWPAHGIDNAGQGLDFQWTIDITEPPPPPPNDFCETAEPIGDVVDYPFSTTTATASLYGTCMTSPDIWYLYTASTSGDIIVSLCGSEYDTKLAVYDGNSCDPLSPEIECNDDWCGLQSQITYTAVEGNLYLIQVGGFSSNTGNGVISIGPPPAPPENDFCETAEAIGLVENYPFSTTQATASGYGTCMTSADIWYVYTAEFSGPTIVSLCGSEYDTKLAVYDGSSCDPLSPEIECNDDFCGLQSQITYVAVEGNEYLIQVGGYSSATGDGVISIMPPPPPECCQEVIPPEGSWTFITTDTDLGYTVFDNYICEDEIGEITFQGLDLHWTGSSWEECVEDPMDFYVKFYPDIGAYPDTVNPVCEYTVTPTRTATGIMYGGVYELIEYSIALPQPCSQTEGWLSIQGVGNGEVCVFMWGGATSGDGLSYQRYPDGSMTQRPDDLARCMAAGKLQVNVDIKPESCPNPLNIGPYTSEGPPDPQGKLPTAILGTEDFDVTTIDPSTVTLEGVSALRWAFEDVAAPVVDPQDPCDCTEDGPDGFVDLTLKFSRQEIVEALNQPPNGELPLTMAGELYDGTEFEGVDCVVIISSPYIGLVKPTAGIPATYVLRRNIPNPFNATTRIPFGLPEAGNITLKVYNIAGRLVETLVDGHVEAGYHSVVWDCSRHSSGIYFYKLSAGDFVATKKMNLVK